MLECFAPYDITIASADYHSATLTWSDSSLSNSYLIQYTTDNGSWGNATQLTSNEQTVTISGLLSATAYKARISTVCSSDTSAWSDPISFTTLCEPLTLAPGASWVENFESTPGSGAVYLNSCWATPVTSSVYHTPYIYCGLAAASHSGYNSLELRGNNNETNILVLPAFTNALNDLKLKFFANTTAASSQTAGTLEVGYITDPDDPATFTMLETVDPKSESYNRAQSAPYGPFYFASVPTNGRIAIRFASNAFSTSWNLDDITVSALSECMEPIDLQALNLTSTSVDLTWIHTDGYHYDILIWPSNTTDTTIYANVSLDNGPFHIDNLVASTAYSWIARTICNDTTYNPSELHGHFTTPNATMSLPYYCDFEDTSYDYSEFNFSGYGVNQWYIGSATSAPTSDGSAGSRALYISDNQGVSNHYGGSTFSYAYASLDMSFPDIAMEYHLEFDLKTTGECGWDEVSVYLMNGGATLPNSGAPNGVKILNAECDRTSWTHFNLILPDVTGTSKRIVFYWVNDSYIFGQPPAAIDNIVINGNSCARPTHLAANNIMDDQITLSWQENANATSWTINYKVQNSSDPFTQVSATDSTVFVLQNLTPNTNYLCFVTADCDNGPSNPSNPLPFRTACSANGITDLPFFEDFSSSEVIDGSDYLPCWSRLTSNSSHYVYVNNADFESSCLDFHYTPNCYTIAVLPEFNGSIPVNNLMLNFDARRHNLATGALEVGAMTDPTDASTFEVIDTVPITSTYVWDNYTVYCNNYTGYGQYLAFRVNNAGYYTVALDNLTIDYLPGCLPPSNVTVNNISQTAADVTWSGISDAYLVYVTSPTNTISYHTTYNSITIDDLTPSTTYLIQVQSLCGDDSSAVTSGTSFTTSCGLITVTEESPWVESFETYSGSQDYIALSSCWSTPATATPADVTFPAVLNYAQAAHSGRHSLELQGAANMFVLPEFTNDLGTLRISLWGNTNAENASAAGSLDVGVVTNPNDPNSFIFVGSIPATALNRIGHDAPYSDYIGPFDFSSIAMQPGMRIAFRYQNYDASYMSWNLDDFRVELKPACQSPIKHSVVITNITDSEATISWEDNDLSHEAWCVFYKPVESGDDDWHVDTVQNVNTLTLSGLSSSTTYEVYVTTYCGVTVDHPDATLMKQFSTTQVPALLPYATDFSVNDDWRLHNGDCANYWVINSYNPSGSLHGLYVTNNGITAGYDVTATSIVSAEKLFTVGLNSQIMIEYDINIGGENSESWDYDYMKMFLATSTEMYEAATVLPYWADPTYSTHAFNFTPYISQSATNTGSPYDFSLTDGNTIHITAVMDNPNPNPTANSVAKLVFAWINDYASGTQPAALITNLSVTAVPCPQPYNLTVENIGSSEADVYWTPGQDETSWTLQYKKATSTIWNTVTTNSNSYHLFGLSSNSNYNVRVKAECGSESSQYIATTFATSTCSSSQQCLYNFHLVDSYGDGWNGGSITVYQNGSIFKQITLTDAYTADIPVALCDNAAVSIVWNSGLYDYECSFTLYGPDGMPLYSNGNLGSISSTTLFSFTTDCSSIAICDAPDNLAITHITTTEASVTWDANDATAWVIQYKQAIASSWEPEIYLLTNQREFSNLITNTTYDVRVKARCPSGVWSDWSDILIFTTLIDSTSIVNPTVITNSANSITQNSATLNGAIINQGNQPIIVRGFEWKVVGASIYQVANATNSGTVFSANLTGLVPGTSYTFRAFATTAFATSYGEEMTFVTPDATECAAPTDLDTVSVANESITITWTDNADANKWYVRRRAENNPWITETAYATTHTIAGLTGNTTYEIQVQAVCAVDHVSEWSNTLTVITKDVGINNHLLNSIKLYPNPANDVINVQFTMNDVPLDITAMEVYDVYGKLIRTVDDIDNPTRINVAGLASGMYFVRVTTEEGVATKAFVKK